jgi:hypothetical protein
MLRYSKDKPTVPGFYFVMACGDLSGNVHQTVVRIYKSQKDLKSPDRVFWDGDGFSIDNDCFGEFAGPITEPIVNYDTVKETVRDCLEGIGGLIAVFMSEDNVYVVSKEASDLNWIALGGAESILGSLGLRVHVRFKQDRTLDEMFPGLDRIL